MMSGRYDACQMKQDIAPAMQDVAILLCTIYGPACGMYTVCGLFISLQLTIIQYNMI